MQTSVEEKKYNFNIFGIERTHPDRQASTLSALKTPVLGRLPEVILIGSFGLLFIAFAFSYSISMAQAALLYWLGVLLVVLPVAYRLFSTNTSRPERIGLVIFLGLGFYLVKVMHSPFMYTYWDELLHYRNADNILRSGTLFGGNSILPVSAYYPGLESVTTAVASLSGLDIFISGLTPNTLCI